MFAHLLALILAINAMAIANLPGGITVTSGAVASLATPYGTTSQQGMVRFGPWTFGTNQYFVINDEGAQSGNNTFFINKRDAAGNWTQFGDGGTTAPWFVGQIFQVVKSGDFLYVLTNDLDHIPGNYWIHKWDTTADTMTHIDTGIAVDAAVENGENEVNTYAGLVALSSGNLVFAFPSAVETVGGHNYYRTSWAEYDGVSWTAPVLLAGQAGNARSYGCYAITVNSTGRLRFWVVSQDHYVGSGNPTNFWLHQISSNAGVFGTLQTISMDLNINIGNWFAYGPALLPLAYTDASAADRIVVPFIGGSATTGPPAAGLYSPGPALSNWVAVAADSGDTPAFSTIEVDSTTQMWGFQLTLESLAVPIYQNGVLMLLWTSPTSFDAAYGSSAGNAYWSFSLDNGATWTAAAAFLTYAVPFVPSGLSPADDGQSAVLYLADVTGRFAFSTRHYYFTLAVTRATLPTVNPGPAGRKPVPLHPNQFDFCLHRENRLYCAIDVARLSCANIPACFSVDEREWGAAS